MLQTLVAAAVVVVLLALRDAHRSGRHAFRLVQFRPMAPPAGPAATARVNAGREHS